MEDKEKTKDTEVIDLCQWIRTPEQITTQKEAQMSDGNRVQHLHGDAEVHHGNAGVAMPADVHGGVASVTLTFKGRARAAELLFRLQLGSNVLQMLW